MVRVEPRHLVLLVLRRRLEVRVGQHHGTELQLPVVQRPVQRQEVQDVVSEAPDAPLLDRDDDAVVLGEVAYEVDVEWLHETGVGHRHGEVGIALLHLVRGDEGLGEAGAEGEDGDAVRLLLAATLAGAELGVGAAVGGRLGGGEGADAAGKADDASLSDLDGGALKISCEGIEEKWSVKFSFVYRMTFSPTPAIK